ncbi:MAG: methyltransferase domain-containing protein [Candidatus Daviesbacteria bacterium]|nr:methyltransferase domain-containing protein [Candidatus Daviesbacteria bacterium]
MHKYFFVLGSNPNLSKVEILAFFGETEDLKIITSSKEVLILETAQEINPHDLIVKLGGTIKVGEIVDSLAPGDFTEQFPSLATDINFLSKLFDPQLQKITFGISVYNAGTTTNQINSILREATRTLPKMKKFLQTSYRASFFKPQERSISSVSVVKNKLLTEGFELAIFIEEQTILFGKTLAVQNFEDYSFRDYQRPGRDAEAGMLPPKLAKIMINIAGKDINDTLLDPFCGNGTILQELILLGYKNIIGTDFKSEQIEKTNQNIDWLFQQYQDLVKSDFNIKTFTYDVRKLNQTFKEEGIDAIITEPFLGSPKSKHFNIPQIENEIKILEKLYLDAFYQFKNILKKNGKIVIIFPAFKFGNTLHYLNILPQLFKLGFSPLNFQENSKYKDLNLEVSERGSIIYSRPDQTIHREIFIFQQD